MKKIVLAAFLVAFVFLNACKDNTLGDVLQPAKDKVGIFELDTMPVKASFYAPDYVNTRNLDLYALGAYWDPSFGKVTSDFAMQLRFGDVGYLDSVTQNIVIDSTYMVLAYTEFYGDTNTVNEVKLYRLNKDILRQDSSLNSSVNPSAFYNENDLLGDLSFKANNPADKLFKVPVSGSSDSIYAFGLQVNIDNSLGNYLVSNVPKYKNDVDLFVSDYFKGVYAKWVFGNRTIVNIDRTLLNNYGYYVTQLKVVYHNPNESVPVYHSDTVFDNGSVVSINNYTTTTNTYRYLSFYSNKECGAYSYIQKDFSDTPINPTGTEEIDGDVYIRSLGALNVKIDMPDIKNSASFQPLKGQDSARIIVNNATLTFTIDQNKIDVDKYLPPNRLLAYFDYNGTRVSVPDLNSAYNTTGSGAYFGGYINQTDYTYSLNITEYTNYLLSFPDKTSKSIYLQPENTQQDPYFTILGGIKNKTNPVKLKIVYTRY